MKYIICRASNLWSDVKPCENAVIDEIKVIDGQFQDVPFQQHVPTWTIEIPTIAELTALQDFLGEKLIVDRTPEGHPRIMIYDDYIE